MAQLRSAQRARHGLRLSLLLASLWLVVAGCKKAPSSDESSAQAETTFASVCARCHGVDGKGGIAAGSSNAPRNFTDAEFQKSRTDAQLKDAIRKGKGAMPAFGNLYPDPDLDALVAKIRSFNPATKKP